MTSLNVINDVLTSTPLCLHTTLIQKSWEQYFKNAPCFCKFDVYSEKQLKDIKNSFDFITFGNMIFKQIITVIDRIITMQFPKMQIEIHGSLVTIQYYTKCTDPLYPKFTSKKFSALNFC